ncbi:hypothetical protein PFICI_14041 [Pestalotiopsis fici W106-1]|uniref:2EXR domain-containing protein n=1 Tax=Pestalotiopsis fici (strain W106-1 / CGMCC3.15140) TaxID=1229662 RepID=W3WJS4_PESFW|nr:uncharacterized protein PFICI_14041 [Pestalotiopsis fici W106-1]ETS74175.1 hypothetical protein PFICI_14041 [Pestalotiopsis fici W106-1]
MAAVGQHWHPAALGTQSRPCGTIAGVSLQPLGTTGEQTLQSFSRFRLLTAELRVLVWKFALTNESDERLVIFDRYDMRIIPTPHLISPLLFVNWETRVLALKHYNTEVAVYHMPDTQTMINSGHGGLVMSDAAIQHFGAAENEYGPKGCIRLRLTSDTFMVGEKNTYMDCRHEILSRRTWVGALRDGNSPRIPLGHEMAVSARISRAQLSLVQRVIKLDYAETKMSPSCCHRHRQMFFNYFCGLQVDVLFVHAEACYLFFDAGEAWHTLSKVVGNLFDHLSRYSFKNILTIYGQDMCVEDNIDKTRDTWMQPPVQTIIPAHSESRPLHLSRLHWEQYPASFCPGRFSEKDYIRQQVSKADDSLFGKGAAEDEFRQKIAQTRPDSFFQFPSFVSYMETNNIPAHAATTGARMAAYLQEVMDRTVDQQLLLQSRLDSDSEDDNDLDSEDDDDLDSDDDDDVDMDSGDDDDLARPRESGRGAIQT